MSIQSRIKAFETLNNNPTSSPSSLKPGLGHNQSSSISSFHSVSLHHSDDEESFENVSATQSSYEQVSPIRENLPTLSMGTGNSGSLLSANSSGPSSPTLSARTPPKLPERRKKPPPIPAKQAPPMPPRRTASAPNQDPNANLKAKLTRRTPVPPAARARYVALFDANLAVAKKALELEKQSDAPSPSPSASRLNAGTLSPPRTRQGWRGISVDLTTAPPSQPPSPAIIEMVAQEKLPGAVVKRIWQLSRLPRQRLNEIWEESVTASASSSTASLDASGSKASAMGGLGGVSSESFIAGMWRIDEELRRRRHSMKTHSKSSDLLL
ncbi:hypothetical protein CYLTODRAFT_490512 [Cylindrobasidium torrendii FP15055 ss-10]|uniref:EH domain-containing protein n=1 Tax=Cylindrobasidium torrendii FP15055 ss-10 TaxID=1314674 RepID=A0A0D7BAP7_9AGAR|nr:hypothetical protein CYLTODRAFT_490512 [Cylindrobasidium torrendii FP15055 ss-10]